MIAVMLARGRGDRANMDTVSAPAPIRLNDQIPPWHRQPGESADNYHAFSLYRCLKPSRRLSEGYQHVAEQTGRRTSTIARAATHYRWVERVAAYDQHLAQIDAHTDREQSREAHQRTTGIVDQLSTLLEDAVSQLDPAELTPTNLIKLSDIVLRWRSAVYGQATERIDVTGSVGLDAQVSGNLDVTVQRWLDMPESERQAELDRLGQEFERKRQLVASETTTSTTSVSSGDHGTTGE